MSAIIRDSFKTTALFNFIKSLTSNSLYLGIGRPQPWDTVSNIDSEIPIPENTIAMSMADWKDMLALKKINSTDIQTGIFKEMWKANVKYDIYRHNWNGSINSVYNGQNQAAAFPSSLGDVKCFVITPEYTIYICIKHPIVNGVVQPSLYSPSTGTPVGINTGVVKTADGYYWKYLASTSAADLVKFSSKYYHPIKTLTSAVSDTDPYYIQWLNQGYSAMHGGGIYVINVLSAGTGYNGGISGTRVVTDAEADAEFKIIGDGTGLKYVVTYGAGGSISDIEITNPGSGYTHATIKATGGRGATFDIIYTPMSGLGANPVKDSVARHMLLDVTLTGAEGSGDFSVTNDYRKICLIYNPTNFGSSTVATASTLSATITLYVASRLGLGAFPVDSIITGSTSGAKGRVVEYNNLTGALKIIRTIEENLNNPGANNSFQIAETITANPGTGSTAILNIANPEVQPFSGELLYSEYRAPISRAESQTEDIKITVKF